MHLILLLQAVHLSSLDLFLLFLVAKCIRHRWDHLYSSRSLVALTNRPSCWLVPELPFWYPDFNFTEGIIYSLEIERFPSIKLCCNKSQPRWGRCDSKITSLSKAHGFTLLYIPVCWAWGKLKYKFSHRFILFLFEQCDVHIYSTGLHINCRQQSFETHS